ncbi:hypothetical protein [Streptomyces sp. NPDC002490]|uniref:hypothetical protein n=1 Tax=Streptomyces sp. NPDC002490 TaxID=3154416 RepID=UPI00331D3DA4
MTENGSIATGDAARDERPCPAAPAADEGRVPGTFGRTARHEVRVLASYVRWLGRRPQGIGAGDRPFGYARGQAAMVYGIAFACLVETVGLVYLLREHPVAHAVVLVLDVYTVVMVLGLQAAAVARPHVLSDEALRVRRGAALDVRVPRAEVVAVHRRLRTSDRPEPGELSVDVGAITNVTLELGAPLTRTTLFGRVERFSVVHLYAEEPDDLVRALRSGPGPGPAAG